MQQTKIAPDDFLARKLSIFAPLSARELDALARLQSRESTTSAGSQLVVQGGPIDRAFVLKDGWAVRSKLLEDGRRQILSFVLPGDLIGASGAFVQQAEQSVETLTDAVVAEFKPQRLLTLYRNWPRLAAALSWSSAREESMLAERIISLGRRSAYEAIAHLFLEISQRLQAVGLADKNVFELPVTQVDLADALGLTSVHVSRTLKKLESDALIERGGDMIRILDLKRLAATPAFKAAYLRHQRPPQATRSTLEDMQSAASEKKSIKT